MRYDPVTVLWVSGPGRGGRGRGGVDVNSANARAGRGGPGEGPRPGPDAHIGSPDRFLAPTIPGGEPVRRLRIAQPAQLELACPEAVPRPAALWAGLPEVRRDLVVAVFARLIAHGVVVDDEERAS